MTATTQAPTYDHVRVVSSEVLNRYFAERDISVIESSEGRFESAYVGYHAWKPGFLELTARQHEALMVLRSASPTAALDRVERSLAAFLAKIGWATPEPVDMDDLVRRTQTELVALQNEWELRALLALVVDRAPRTIVEIGTAAGGLLYALTQLAPSDALLVSIDYPSGPYGGGQADADVEMFRSFAGPGQQLCFIRDRSFHYSTLMDLRRILGDRRIDLLFIDGDHSYGAILSDHAMYSPLVAPGGLIAVHDIVLEPEGFGRGADGRLAWEELKRGRRTEELIDPQGLREAPSRRPETFEEMARHAWGIGLIHHEPDAPRPMVAQ